MAEFTLPAHSKFTAGHSHTAPQGASDVRVFQIYRWSPDDDENPRLDSFEVDLDDCGPMVLDALIKIKSEQDSTPDVPPVLPRGHLRVLLHEY